MSVVKIVTNRENYFKNEVGWEGEFTNVEEVKRFLTDGRKSVEIDLETSGMSFMTSEVYSMQLGCLDVQYVIDCETIPLDTFNDELSKLKLIGQNLLFDIPFLYNVGLIPSEIWDTYLAEYCLTAGLRLPPGSRGLGNLIHKYLDIEIDKGEQATIADTGISTVDAINYAANDVKYLTEVAKKQYVELQKKGLTETVRLENSFALVLAYIEYSGVRVDTDKWMGRVRHIEYEEYKDWLALTQLYCESVGVDEIPVFPDIPINWNSSKQVVEVMQHFDIPTLDPKTGKDTVDAKNLIKYEDKHPIVPLYLKYKESNKQVTTYGREWLSNVLDDGRVHTKYKPMVDTGRTACGDTRKGPFPNMQNLPNDSRVRSCFIPKNKRYTFVVCDYSSQESVILADMSQEENLLKFYQTGGADLHSYTAAKVWPDIIGDTPIGEIKEKFPELRGAAKAANFAISYGGSGMTIAFNLNISFDRGTAVYDDYMKAFPGLNKFFEKQKKKTFQKGYILVNKKSGRKRFVDDLKDVEEKFSKIDWGRYKKDDDYKEECQLILKRKSGIERESLNTPIQGTAADMSKMAGVLFFKWIVEKRLFGKVLIPIFLHDEYVVECTKSKADEVSEKLQECMETAGNFFLDTLTIKAKPVTTEFWNH